MRLPTDAYRRASEAHDIKGLLATLAPDAILHSPISDAVSFRGREEIGELLRSVFAVITEIRYFADVGDDRTRALFYRAVVDGRSLEEAARIELDEQGLITELTLFFRPLQGLTALAAALVPRLARRHGRVREAVARLLLRPLASATRLGDRLATWLT